MIRQHQFDKVETGADRAPGASPGEALEELTRPRRDDPRSSSSCPTARSRCAPATWASPRPRPTTSRSGCRGRAPIARSRPARNFEAFQARRMQARFKNDEGQDRTGAHAQRLRPGGGPHAGRRCWRTTRTPTAASTVPAALRGYMGGLERITRS
ncbi:MAG: hypothetical protein MZW92_51825 [Comamonadaceae bacterium]|nr:hypothetical protein [Comamonadaceae bacterium]